MAGIYSKYKQLLHKEETYHASISPVGKFFRRLGSTLAVAASTAALTGLAILSQNPGSGMFLLMGAGSILAESPRIIFPEKYCHSTAYNKLTKEKNVGNVRGNGFLDKLGIAFGIGKAARFVREERAAFKETLKAEWRESGDGPDLLPAYIKREVLREEEISRKTTASVSKDTKHPSPMSSPTANRAPNLYDVTRALPSGAPRSSASPRAVSQLSGNSNSHQI